MLHHHLQHLRLLRLLLHRLRLYTLLRLLLPLHTLLLLHALHTLHRLHILHARRLLLLQRRLEEVSVPYQHHPKHPNNSNPHTHALLLQSEADHLNALQVLDREAQQRRGLRLGSSRHVAQRGREQEVQNVHLVQQLALEGKRRVGEECQEGVARLVKTGTISTGEGEGKRLLLTRSGDVLCKCTKVTVERGCVTRRNDRRQLV